MWIVRWVVGLGRELLFRLNLKESFVRGSFKTCYYSRKRFKWWEM